MLVVSLCIPSNLYTGVPSRAQNRSPLLDRRVDGHLHRGMKRFTRMCAVPSAVNSAVVTANMSARRLIKRSVKRRMYEFPRAVIGTGPK